MRKPSAPRTRKVEFTSESGYTVFDAQGKTLMETGDLFEGLAILREQRGKAELYQNENKVLLAYTTGAFVPSYFRRKAG